MSSRLCGTGTERSLLWSLTSLSGFLLVDSDKVNTPNVTLVLVWLPRRGWCKFFIGMAISKWKRN
jgi:hypothetical protein